MSKSITFKLELDVADHVESDEARKVVHEMVSDMLQDEAYHEVSVEETTADRSDAPLFSLLNVLEELEESDIQKAIDSLDVLTEDDEDE